LSLLPPSNDDDDKNNNNYYNNNKCKETGVQLDKKHRQYTYKRNVHAPAPAPNHCDRGKAISATYSVAVAQLVEALCYKPEGRGFDPRWCH
jgi:hypothetical protein